MMIEYEIYEALKHRGVSQTEICKDLGITVQNFNAFIHGARGMSYDTFCKILSYLGKTIGEKDSNIASDIPPDKMRIAVQRKMQADDVNSKTLYLNTGLNRTSLISFINGNRTYSTKKLEKIFNALNLGLVPYKK